MSKLGIRLKELRKEHKLTQPQLADKLNVGKSTVAMWETGDREPDYEMLQKIADFFEVSTDYLLGRVDDPHLYSNREEAERAVQKKGFIDLEGLTEEQQKLIKQLIEQMKKEK
ncbi:helix-turn-helix domain protein [Caldalkalibacillus thermarum TA2.A1]|uniref:Helix-turn-helix domain protein n=1 Tax=Caldalkalibacillus thermarum (strain TA2.A1) TaxID=986075 RepID=F5L9C0_CALTT|nr:helix-turn-helix transcriptional regulator [Caldalkalibacillus thermarum]EGL82062.1 helix-turn-helix domain protein [Caldalkalibacillus thermarum TA2.A1]QZT34019.1 helix-turn-helix domain-containing protein [Caldalkalibacillus thermarum TA2.A1]